MTEPEQPTTYLGDAVYSIFDGFGVWLHTDSHLPNEAGNKIYLEPQVIQNLFKFLSRKEVLNLVIEVSKKEEKNDH